MIVVSHLNKQYSGKKAIDDISFEIQDGETVGLLGLNGAGKSTILKILGCYLAPSSGEATIFGNSIANNAEQVRKLIGYLPDTPPLYNEMTVRDYLVFVAKIKNVPKSKIPVNLDKVCEKTGITKFLEHRLGHLSHGYRQRVSISQALIHDPKVIILDEPINGLDPVQIKEMRDLILSLKKHHTVILSSHILSEVTKTCDRIFVMDKGNLVAKGSEQELRGEVAGSFNVEVSWKNGSLDILEKMKSLKGVVSVQVDTKDDVHNAIVGINEDIRSVLAEVIITCKGDLIKLAKIDIGLESVFMKILENSSDI